MRLRSVLYCSPFLLLWLAACGSDAVEQAPADSGDSGAPKPDAGPRQDAGSGQEAGICTPGEARCNGEQTAEICDADGASFTKVACADGERCLDGACTTMLCTPGSHRCLDDGSSETCAADGMAWVDPQICGAGAICYGAEGCISRCEAAERAQTSAGCSFFALSMEDGAEDAADGVLLLNSDDTLEATARVVGTTSGVEQLLEEVTVPPLGTALVTLPNGAEVRFGSTSGLRRGGSFHVESDLPLQAILHAPVRRAEGTGDSSCLLPEAALGMEYVVASYAPYPALVSYLSVVATADAEVTVQAPVPTLAGEGAPAMAAGESRTFTLHRYDTLNLAAEGDMTGARITSTAPVAVFGASQASGIPMELPSADHLEEQMLPVEKYGKSYALAPYSRVPDDESVWRVLALEEGTAIAQSPPVAGFPASLGKGEFFEFQTRASAEDRGAVLLSSNQRFAIFQYTKGHGSDPGHFGPGDPSMSTVIPVEQFLRDVYAPVPPLTDYPPGTFLPSLRWLHIVRSGDGEVTLDGEPVDESNFTRVGDYAFATVAVEPGVRHVSSTSPLSVTVVTNDLGTADAYPAAMALRPVAP